MLAKDVMTTNVVTVSPDARGTREVVDNIAVLPPKLRAFMGRV